MPRFSFNRKTVKLKRLLGIRVRLALLAVILVAPLMLERARSLEEMRASQIALASTEFADLARHSADAQREVISSVEMVLKSAAQISASASATGRSCEILRASLPQNLPWIRSLLIADGNGRVQCSTNEMFLGLDLSDRIYFQRAQEDGEFVLSDVLLARPVQKPIVMAAYPVPAIAANADGVVLASINLDWMSKMMSSLSGQPGVTAALIDSKGVVLAAPEGQTAMVGSAIGKLPLFSAIAEKALHSDGSRGSESYVGADGSKRAVSFARIAGTDARLIASIDEDKLTATINRDIRETYLQLGLVSLLVLLVGWIAAEKLIIEPINVLAALTKRVGEGDRSARAVRSRLPAEFVPLARAFNAMVAQLSQRERDLVNSNDRLTVIASIDMLSGLANRRGFQSRLDFEWIKAQQSGSDLSLLMIDVDHFKLYNDSYGHPEGDTCLTRMGEVLATIAADSMGFAARYGGEEFCLLLPNTDARRAYEIGEAVRLAVRDLGIPHRMSSHERVTVSIGLASIYPNDGQHSCDLIEAADAALYAAKHRGRDRVVEHGFLHTAERDNDIAMAS